MYVSKVLFDVAVLNVSLNIIGIWNDIHVDIPMFIIKQMGFRNCRGEYYHGHGDFRNHRDEGWWMISVGK